MGKAVYRLQELIADTLMDASENYRGSEAQKNTTEEDSVIKFSIDRDVCSQIYEMSMKKEVDGSHDPGQQDEPLGGMSAYGVVPSTSEEKLTQPGNGVKPESVEAMDVEVDAKTESVAPSPNFSIKEIPIRLDGDCFLAEQEGFELELWLTITGNY